MNTSTEQIYSFFIALLYQLPIVVIYVTGIVLAIVFRKRAGGASLLAAIGFLFLILGSAIQIGYMAWVFFFMQSTSIGTSTIQTVMRIQAIGDAVATFIGMALLTIAIFVNRKQSIVDTKGA